MIVECSQCQTKFKIADEKITPRGVKVRCSKCKHMFVVKPEGVEAGPEKPRKDKTEGIPDDIFKAPTRVESRPPVTPPPGKKFPLPPPPMPPAKGPSLADKIDLNSDDPISAPAKLPDPPPLDEMPTMPSRPPAAAKKSDLGDALFSDLSLDSEAKKPLVEPGVPKAKAPPPPPDDDPFAGIDVSAPPAPAKPQPPPAAGKPPPWAAPKPAAPSGSDPVSGEAVGKPTKDLFDDLGDPFAGIPSAGASGVSPLPAGEELLPEGSDLPAELAGPPPATKSAPPKVAAAKPPSPGRPQDDIFANIDSSPGGTASPAEADDPFAGIDTSVPTGSPAAGIPDSLAEGDDPFSQLDTSDAAAGADEGAVSSGLELDSEGRLTGKPLPEPPPPTKAAPVQESSPAPVQPVSSAVAPMPMAGLEPRRALSSGVLWAYKVGFGLLALVVVLLLFVAYRSGGKPDLTSWSTYVRAFTGDEGAEEVTGDLEALEVKNTEYRTRSGHPLLVVWGKVGNQTQAQKAAVVVSGQLLGEKGQELGKFTAPAGVTFTPQEVFEMTDHLAVASAYHSRLEKVRDLKVPPEGEIPFMLVFYDHPEEMEDMRIRVLPRESQDPFRGLLPPSEPAEGEEETVEEEGPRRKPPASAAGVVVKKEGTIVRLKPEEGGGPEAGGADVEEVDDVPVEVVEDVDEGGEAVEDIE